MEIEGYDHGVPSWIDVSTPDLARATAFYADLFIWEVVRLSQPTGTYCMASIAGQDLAGLAQAQSGGRVAWTCYVNVDRVQPVVAAVDANGGKVLLPPSEMNDAGTMAVVADPVGATFGLWEAGRHFGAGLVDEPGAFAWNDLVTTDPDAAAAFYGEVLGWQAVHETGAAPAGPWSGETWSWQLDGRTVAGMTAVDAADLVLHSPAAGGSPPRWAGPRWEVTLAVEDAEHAACRIPALGGAVVAGPFDGRRGRTLCATDPVGAAFTVVALDEAALAD